MDPVSLEHFVKKYPAAPILSEKGEPTNLVRTCVARMAFHYLGAPKERVRPATGEKFSAWGCALIFPRAADITAIRQLVTRVARERFGDTVDPTTLRLPLKQQSTLHGRYDGFEADGFFVNCESQYAVPVVGSRRGPDGRFPKLDPASDAVYSGMWVIAELNAYAYPKPGAKGQQAANKGVSLGLRAIQKVADDDEFRGSEPGGNFSDIDHGGVAAHGGNAGVSAPARAPTVADVW